MDNGRNIASNASMLTRRQKNVQGANIKKRDIAARNVVVGVYASIKKRYQGANLAEEVKSAANMVR